MCRVCCDKEFYLDALRVLWRQRLDSSELERDGRSHLSTSLWSLLIGAVTLSTTHKFDNILNFRYNSSLRLAPPLSSAPPQSGSQ